MKNHLTWQTHLRHCIVATPIERFLAFSVTCALVIVGATTVHGDDRRFAVDAATLHHKVLCGYQGWFRCPGDGANRGWRHWSRKRDSIDPDSVTFEMWPDIGEIDNDEKYPAAGFLNPDGTPASLFSSVNPKTVDRHFRWMKEYGIDGVFLQRFLTETSDRSMDMVLQNVRQSARTHQRVYALCYDLTGTSDDKLYDTIVADWKRMVDEKKLTRDSCYLRHHGKPVLFVWGFYSDRFSAKIADRIIEFFKNDPKYSVTLVGGCQWHWRTEKDDEWSKVFRRFDVLSPWNVGNSTEAEGRKFATTNYWQDDVTECQRHTIEYLPVIYPGFSWTNLKGQDAVKDDLPRLGGDFYWKQFTAAADLDLQMAYVAMFDEVDEGTAIFKVTNSPPMPGRFTTYEQLPADWYLRLTGEGTKLLRGERESSVTVPIRP